MTVERHIVLGTAGHIDHGKSALVQRLTGTDPDRLKEEKVRGITIDLGFADVEMAPGRVLSFVDVPGHERFVRTMVAGAAGIDAVLLVVAADDGIRPQTREHLEICSLLGVRHGVVALTKTDLVDPELVDVLALEVREFLGGGFLEGAPVVPVSSRTGSGMDRLRGALQSLFDRIPERPVTGVPRLPVDRSFVLKGFGTVVTGTLVSGSLHEGDEVEILPGGRKSRIRGIQVHHHPVKMSRAGQRTAVNLQGLDRWDVPRGSTVTAPGRLLTTGRIWARVRLLDGAPPELARGGWVRFHQGTSERNARMRILHRAPDGELLAELFLGGETVLLPGDRFILRRPAPVDTVGGGSVVDVRPPHGRPHSVESWVAEEDGRESAILSRLRRAGDRGRLPRELAAELGCSDEELLGLRKGLDAGGRLVEAGGCLFAADAWRKAEDQALEVLRRFHDEEPLRPGMPRERLRAQAAPRMPQEAWREFLDRLAASGKIRLAGDRVASGSHRVILSALEQKLAERLEHRFLEAGLDPPEPAAVLNAVGGGDAVRRIVNLMIEDGRLLRLRDGRLFHREALNRLVDRLRNYAATCERIDVPAFKELAGVTRRSAIPLLEYLDAERYTRRIGNVRQILIH